MPKYLVEITFIKQVEAKDAVEAGDRAERPLPNLPGFEKNIETTVIHD